MIRLEEIRKGSGQIQVKLRILEMEQLRVKEGAAADCEPSDRPSGISLSGFRVVIRRVSTLRAISQVLWAFLKLWLFER